MKLPSPKSKGTVSVEQAIMQRRTIRSYSSRMLNLEQLSQLLWAASGITEVSGFKRAVPSAGALYPMDIYAVIGQFCIKKFEAGVYHYQPQKHWLNQLSNQDLREDVARASLSQIWMAEAPLNFIITAEYKRMAIKYGQRGDRYTMIEAGHMGQNIFLQAEAMGLAAGIVGAFHDKVLIDILKIPYSYKPLLIMPIGYTK
jgi:SagB-type dehydrogenase family enzyme